MLTFMFSDDKQVGLLLAEDAPPMVEGSRVTITSGDAAGRQLYCIAAGGPVLLGASLGEAQELLFDGVRPGDEVVVDNRDYLAFCHYYRHHVADPREIPRFAVDDNYLYPTYHFDDTKAYGAPMAGMAHDGNIKVPLFLIQHSRDTSCWLIDGVRYDEVVRSQVGDRVSEMWRFWVMDNAEHMPGSAIAPTPPPVPTSRLVEGWSAMETGVDLMVAWIERNEQPPEDTEYTFDRCHNHVSLAPTAAERRGIQPVVTATANGGVRADVKAGDEVQLAATSEVPRGVGGIVELAWDFEGTGEWSAVPLGGGLTSSVSEQAAHRYEAPGVYFPSFRVVSHLQGDRADPYGRIMNVGRCRVVAT